MNSTLITGASSGIGYELAHLFARDKHNLILASRNKDKLQQLSDDLTKRYSVDILVISVDLGNSDAAKELYQIINDHKATIHYLVNNVGYLVKGPFKETPWEKEQSLIQMQCQVYTELTKLFLPDIMQNKGGILNVGSTGSFVPGPYSAVYCAAKSFVLSFTEALAEELKGTGIKVTALCPGGTDTPFHGSERKKASLMTASKVAQIGYKGFMKGKRIVIPGLNNKMQVFFARFVPRKTITKVTARILAKS